MAVSLSHPLSTVAPSAAASAFAFAALTALPCKCETRAGLGGGNAVRLTLKRWQVPLVHRSHRSAFRFAKEILQLVWPRVGLPIAHF